MSVRTNMVEVEQGSDRWRELRRGRITASRMGDVIAGKKTKRYEEYRQQIALELLGYEEEEESAPWFEHGKAMEPYARGAYQWRYNVNLTPNVFFIHPKYDWLGASPDGVRVDTFDDPVEIKCRAKLSTYLAKVDAERRTGKIEAVYRPQVQAQMWVMGCLSIKFINYYHDAEQQIRKLHMTVVHRDDNYIAKLEERSLEFMLECYQLADKDPGGLAA